MFSHESARRRFEVVLCELRSAVATLVLSQTDLLDRSGSPAVRTADVDQYGHTGSHQRDALECVSPSIGTACFLCGSLASPDEMRVKLPVAPGWLRWLGVTVVAVFIFYTSILTTPPSNPVVPGRPDLLPLDKWRHFLAYGALAAALLYALLDAERPVGHVLAVVVGVAVCYGIGIELWQSTIPNRYFSLGDAYANAIGSLLVCPWYLLHDRVDLWPVLSGLDFSWS